MQGGWVEPPGSASGEVLPGSRGSPEHQAVSAVVCSELRDHDLGQIGLRCSSLAHSACSCRSAPLGAQQPCASFDDSDAAMLESTFRGIRRRQCTCFCCDTASRQRVAA